MTFLNETEMGQYSSYIVCTNYFRFDIDHEDELINLPPGTPTYDQFGVFISFKLPKVKGAI